MRKYIIGIAAGVLLTSAVVVLAGNLDSPGAPDADASKSYNLEEIYDRLDTGAAGTQTAFTEPSVGPGSTGHTLDEVMGKAPAVDATDGAGVADVATGKTFWGLTSGEWGLQTGTAAGGVTYEAGVPKTGAGDLPGSSFVAGEDGHADMRKGVAWPEPRFITGTTGIVTDTLTGLIWLENANCAGVLPTPNITWTLALTYSNALYDGCTDCFGTSGDCGLSDGSVAGDWRLPNVREMQSLVHYGFFDRAVPNTAGTGKWSEGDPFTGVQSGRFYWSSTTRARFTDYALCVNLYEGNVSIYAKTDPEHFVWPVRGGQ